MIVIVIVIVTIVIRNKHKYLCDMLIRISSMNLINYLITHITYISVSKEGDIF